MNARFTDIFVLLCAYGRHSREKVFPSTHFSHQFQLLFDASRQVNRTFVDSFHCNKVSSIES